MNAPVLPDTTVNPPLIWTLRTPSVQLKDRLTTNVPPTEPAVETLVAREPPGPAPTATAVPDAAPICVAIDGSEPWAENAAAALDVWVKLNAPVAAAPLRAPTSIAPG
jgi:hypothetical protein